VSTFHGGSHGSFVACRLYSLVAMYFLELSSVCYITRLVNRAFRHHPLLSLGFQLPSIILAWIWRGSAISGIISLSSWNMSYLFECETLCVWMLESKNLKNG
jgi:hypothetical protein